VQFYSPLLFFPVALFSSLFLLIEVAEVLGKMERIRPVFGSVALVITVCFLVASLFAVLAMFPLARALIGRRVVLFRSLDLPYEAKDIENRLNHCLTFSGRTMAVAGVFLCFGVCLFIVGRVVVKDNPRFAGGFGWIIAACLFVGLPLFLITLCAYLVGVCIAYGPAILHGECKSRIRRFTRTRAVMEMTALLLIGPVVVGLGSLFLVFQAMYEKLQPVKKIAPPSASQSS